MKLVVIESPLAGDFARNKSYAKMAMLDSLSRGEAPLASHLLYDQPGLLDDTIPEEREKGMLAGFEWGQHADLVAVYNDLGISEGMLRGIALAKERKCPVEYRTVPGWNSSKSTSGREMYGTEFMV